MVFNLLREMEKMRKSRVERPQQHPAILTARGIFKDVDRLTQYWHLWSGVDAAAAPTEYQSEMNESRFFWNHVSRSLRDSVIARLGRLYDQSRKTVTQVLRNLRRSRKSAFASPRTRIMLSQDLTQTLYPPCHRFL
jgi:AbiU2